jgi:DNA-binding NtrC family response regulator
VSSILIVDDKDLMRDSLCEILVRAGYDVDSCANGLLALAQVQKATYDIIITDLKMPELDGIGFLAALKEKGCESKIIMMTAYASVDTAVEAMQNGAYDYIQKPFDADEILILVERALSHYKLEIENEALKENINELTELKPIIGDSDAVNQLQVQMTRVAKTKATIFIRGESGTGKELVAREIHMQSSRCNQPFLCVNCAALSSTLLESEMFGHEKGAFTGAEKMRKGRFELADGGTLMLDEISEMDLQLQAKLLRVLQEREFERVGSALIRKVDVRVIATSNRNLEAWVQDGKFREDLYYRLNVVPILVPSLRSRSGLDIELLCNHYLKKCAQDAQVRSKTLDNEALNYLQTYHWPGNVRELENLMERVSILGFGSVITRNEIKNWLDDSLECDNEPVKENDSNMKLAEIERDYIKLTLQKFGGHRQKSAKALGIGVRTLGMKIKKWEEQGILLLQ